MEVKKTSKFDIVPVTMGVESGEARPYSQVHLRLLQPVGYDP